ncbi:MAG: SMC-Scp complex subunit ScpB [Kiritimatiellia bacterium]
MSRSTDQDLPLQSIVAALILGADHALTLEELRGVLEEVEKQRVAQIQEDADVTDVELEAAQAEADLASGRTLGTIPREQAESAIATVRAEREARAKEKSVAAKTYTPSELRKSIEAIRMILKNSGLGIELVEINGGYRFQTAAICGPWVRQMLNKGRATVLSRPSIETLAIIAYRQPVSRSEIESVRGVNAGHVIKALMEMQLVRIVGRSDLPGRPFLFGTTPQFLEHFGLKNLDDLERIKGAQDLLHSKPAAPQRPTGPTMRVR